MGPQEKRIYNSEKSKIHNKRKGQETGRLYTEPVKEGEKRTQKEAGGEDPMGSRDKDRAVSVFCKTAEKKEIKKVGGMIMRKGIKYLVLGALLFCSIFYAREAEAASVRINKTNFPDALLREKLKYKDYNKDGKLSDKEIRKIKKIDLRAEKDGKYWKINLKGISRLTSLKNLSLAALVIENRAEMEQLKSLQKLYFYQYQDVGIFDLGRMGNVTDFSLGSQSVQEVVLKNNKKLKKLYLGFASTKNLKEVDLCENPNLEELELRGEFMEKIKMQNHGKLKKMELRTSQEAVQIERLPKLAELRVVDSSKMKKLAVQDCPALGTLWIQSCPSLQDLRLARVDKLWKVTMDSPYYNDINIKKLDFSELPGLRSVQVESEDLEELILPRSGNLVSLDLTSCHLKKLDLSQTPKLSFLSLGSCDIDRLDLTKVPQIEVLKIWWQKKVKKLDFSRLKKLKELHISHMDRVKKLNLPNPKRLKELSIYGCKSLKKINFNKMTNLKSLEVYENKGVKKLDIRKLKKLEHLTWQDGILKRIVWGKKKNLETIDVSYNKISGTFDFRKFTELTKVWCDHNKLTRIYGGVNLYTLRCEKNKLKKVDVRKAKHLWTLGCAGNKKARIYLYTTLDEGGVSASASAKISYVKKY